MFYLLKQNKLILLLSLTACVFYFLIINHLGGFAYIKATLYLTGDAREYQEYTYWLSGDADYNNAYRTFFYPLLILCSEKLLGFYGIFWLQFLFWITGSVLVFFTTLKLTDNKLFASLSFLIVIANVSLIVYTAHALTEVSAFFFLTVLSFQLTKIKSHITKPGYFFGLIFLVSVLAAIKPLFQLFWYPLVLFVLAANFKSTNSKALLILIIALASIPVITQKAINITEHNTFSGSAIADFNLRHYLYRKVKFFEETKDSSLQKWNKLSDSMHNAQKAEIKHVLRPQIISYLAKHPVTTFKVYKSIIVENFTAGNMYINSSILSRQNMINLYIGYFHLLMPFVWILTLLVKLKKRDRLFYFTLGSGIILFYILYTSGITYWAGDRIIISSIAIWSVLYPFLIFYLFTKTNPNKNVYN